MAVLTYKCSNCGGPLTWDAEKQAYFCDYCNSRFTQEEVAKMQPQQTVQYNCPSCGAQIMTDATTAATYCYYCHNPVVLADRLSGDRLPDCVIPFEIDEKKAREIFMNWVKRHRYIPKAFYDEKQIAHLGGVYFPYWIYNCKINGAIEGSGKRLRTWVTGSLQFTETSVYDISKAGIMQIDNVMRIALKKASRVLCEGVMPFKTEKMKPFSPAYLQGYTAEMRDVEKEGLSQEVEDEVRRFAAEKLKSQAGADYNSIEISRSEADIADENWKYALLPVWTLTYTEPGTGKLYYFSINGQSGKTCGELPVDKRRLLGLFIMVFVPVFLLLLLMLYFLF
ncbi:MAG: zinc ribbon domain-containing protein [Eubacteriales bacterium]|nr:zinc ribbon domain-containing protein [Eubacteriales bacterium]